MKLHRLAPVLSVAGALALGVGAASAAQLGVPGALTGAPPPAPLAAASSTVQQPVAGVVSGTTGAVAPAVTPQVHGLIAPVRGALPALPRQRTAVAAEPPPPGIATAVGAHVAPLGTCVSCTAAGAGPGSSRSEAQALRVLGVPLSGGSADSSSARSGALVALPANPLLDLALADWVAEARACGDCSAARTRSALADLDLGGGRVATVAVLESVSEATFDRAASHGRGSTNGVDLSLGDGALVVVLLHSEASSDGRRAAYVASINGTELLASDREGDIPITIPGVVTIHLLDVYASGGVASATVARVGELLGVPGTVASVLSSTASGATGALPVPPPAPPVPGIAGASAPKVAVPVTPGPAGGAATPSIPVTGAVIGATGLVLLLSGLSLLAASAWRRPSRAAV
jgi:hypothetical protein